MAKTGGQTFTEMIIQSHPKEELWIAAPRMPHIIQRRWYAVRWLAGHYINRIAYPPFEKRWFTLLRHPVDRVISFVGHLHDRGVIADLLARHLIPDGDFRTIAEYPDHQNWMTWVLCDWKERNLERAWANLRDNFHFGFTERFEDFVCEVEDITGSRFERQSRVGVGSTRRGFQLDDDTLDWLEQINSLDMELFRRAAEYRGLEDLLLRRDHLLQC